jgi:hypothetical protein
MEFWRKVSGIGLCGCLISVAVNVFWIDGRDFYSIWIVMEVMALLMLGGSELIIFILKRK